MRTRSKFARHKKADKKRHLGSGYYQTKFLDRECPCIHQTSTPVRFEFDLYDDIIFVPARNITNNQLSEAFIGKRYEKIPRFQIKKRMMKVKKKSKKGAIKALTFILCSIL